MTNKITNSLLVLAVGGSPRIKSPNAYMPPYDITSAG